MFRLRFLAASRIMFWRGVRVKFGGAGLCPKWYVRVIGWGEENGDGCVRGTPGRAGEVRADVWEGTREAGGVTGPDHECAGAGGATRGVLHEPEESEGTGNGFADDCAGIDACEGVGAGGDGGDEEEELRVFSSRLTARGGSVTGGGGEGKGARSNR